jgi:hypothetical protein
LGATFHAPDVSDSSLSSAGRKLSAVNKNVDSLIRVLQRMEALGVRSRQEIKAHEMPLEALRAALNADFPEAVFQRERADPKSFADHPAKQTKH